MGDQHGIRRGTTPMHIFRINVPIDQLTQVEIIYAQHGGVKIRRTQDECELGDDAINVLLTQEDTFKLSCDSPVGIQVRIKKKDGSVPCSDVFEIPVLPCLSREVL
jgi:hypothetical protein